MQESIWDLRGMKGLRILKRFIAQGVYSVCIRINYKIVPVTNLNKYLHLGTNGNEYYIYKYRCK